MIMRSCCCCKVTTGSAVLGGLTLLATLAVVAPLVGYLADITDIPVLDVIKNNQKVMEKVLEDSLKMHDWTRDEVSSIMTSVRDWFPSIILVAAVYVGVTALFALLLVIGVCARVRCLLVPFLVLSMLEIILSGTVGIVAVVALFQLSTVHGLVSLAVYLVSAIVSLYCWATVLSAYKYLGSSNPLGYTYSPVTPAKDIPQYYPSAPQYFPMDDYADGSTRR